MAYRYGDAVSVSIDVDPQLRQCQIPRTFCSRWWENAFMHGLTNESGVCQGSIGILIYESEGTIVIEVSDDGKGMEPTAWICSTREERSNRGTAIRT